MKHIFLTPGEPAGIGPEVTVKIAQEEWPVSLTVIADPKLLQETGERLNLPLKISIINEPSQQAHVAVVCVGQ